MAGTSPAATLQLFQQAQSLHRAGQLGLAESHYLRVVKLEPTHADAWHLLGVLAYQGGNSAKAIKHYRRAVELRPGFAAAFNNLALAHKARGEHALALAAFDRALLIRPEYVEAAFNAALLHEAGGDFVAAERAYRHALALRPEYLDAALGLANLLRRERRAAAARELLLPLQRAQPEHAVLAGNLALVELDLGSYGQARALAVAAARFAPHDARWWEVQGVAARLQQDLDAALPSLVRACELAPDDAAARFEYGLTLEAVGDEAAARQALAAARALEPDWQRLHWAEALLLPNMPADAAAIDRALQRFAAGLEALHAGLRLANSAQRSGAFEAAAATGPFQLHYLPRDNGPQQRRFAELVQRVALAAAPEFAAAVPARTPSAGTRRRIGFVSAYLHTHTVARYFACYITQLDPALFESFVWHTGETCDAVSASIAAASTHYVHTGATPLELAGSIRAAALDVLIYLDVGLDPRQLLLAAWRLAPVQCAAYGHPVSSGLHSIDYFLAADALEPLDADTHYSETLLRLPGLGTRPGRPPLPGDGSWLHAPGDARPVLLCLQNLIKLVPEFDAMLARIAQGSGARIILFDRCKQLSQAFLDRAAPAFSAQGLQVHDHIELQPLRPYAEFLGGVQAADLILDTPWFSGGGTSLDALGIGTPVVTLEGPMARGRQTAGMLRLLGIEELIAGDADAYVEIAVALCAAAERRADLRSRILQRSAQLFDDDAVLPALHHFLLEAAPRGTS